MRHYFYIFYFSALYRISLWIPPVAGNVADNIPKPTTPRAENKSAADPPQPPVYPFRSFCISVENAGRTKTPLFASWDRWASSPRGVVRVSPQAIFIKLKKILKLSPSTQMHVQCFAIYLSPDHLFCSLSRDI